MIILSFKTYKQSTGDEAVKLCWIVKKVKEKTGVRIIPVVQATDIYRVKKEVGIEVWAQHIDPIDPDRHMGYISPFAVKQAGATGVVINHSEHKLTNEEVKKTLEKAKEYGLENIVIGHTQELVLKYDLLNPNFIAYEKEDLIASGVSMLTKEQDNVKKLISLVKHPLIIGAGISNPNDIKQALSLGAKGVILSSAFVLSKDPEKTLIELASAFL
ncbi:MAG: triose-phosphate isomerase [Candidatus Microgenomates bacterium]